MQYMDFLAAETDLPVAQSRCNVLTSELIQHANAPWLILVAPWLILVGYSL
jgi:hypothetical protein